MLLHLLMNLFTVGEVECKGEFFEGQFDSDMGEQDTNIMLIEVDANGNLKGN